MSPRHVVGGASGRQYRQVRTLTEVQQQGRGPPAQLRDAYSHTISGPRRVPDASHPQPWHYFLGLEPIRAARLIFSQWVCRLGTVLSKVTFRGQDLGTHRLRTGNFVVFPGSTGIGRVASCDGDAVEIEFFESAAEPRVGVVWKAVSEVRLTRLGEQSRVFFRDGACKWRAGRIVGGGPDEYFVRVPNLSTDVELPEARLRIRWEKAPNDPLQVLLAGAHESPRFRDARLPVRSWLLSERAVTGSATGIMSAGVKIHAHQVNAALRIIRDPVQRYLLADEVGMGKTIQAGFVIRQLLIDDPTRGIGIIAPESLIPQWESELEQKFHLSDFGDPCLIRASGDQEGWTDLAGVDLLIIDEAHLLARTKDSRTPAYVQLAALAHSVPRLLLLSATPFSRDATTHMALLHMLDPALFRWEDIEQFRTLLSTRRELAMAVFGLDVEPDPDNPELLDYQFNAVQGLLPEDGVLRRLISDAMASFSVEDDESGIDEKSLNRRVAAVRTHISETYRLHHRVIRNRRHTVVKHQRDDEGLATPFEFTGRSRPSVVRLDSAETEAVVAAVDEWLSACTYFVLDNELDAECYGAVAGILVSKLGGPAEDLQSVLEYRVSDRSTETGLSVAEKTILDQAPLLPFEKQILASVVEASKGDALELLVEAISKRCPSQAHSLVFCGQGALAGQLHEALLRSHFAPTKVHAHMAGQGAEVREGAIADWRRDGGVLVVDETGDVGHNFQHAERVIHARLPWNPNLLEQRIGRVDRYGQNKTARHFVVSDLNREGTHGAWLRLLANGYNIFDESISAVQESIDASTQVGWARLIHEGVEGFESEAATIRSALTESRRHIDEMDSLEASYDSSSMGTTVAARIAKYESHTAAIEQSYRLLIEGAEGFRFLANPRVDGSNLFEPDWINKPLLSPRLLSRLQAPAESRTGFFDRWRLTPDRRLFRRGNPFIDGIESVLALDDRGQASALWRLDPQWENEPLVYFGFDFVVEANPTHVLDVLDGDIEMRPIAVRRADSALPPFQHRVWIPVNSLEAVIDRDALHFLNSRFHNEGRDVNLNLKRISALYNVLGGEANFSTTAIDCGAAARQQFDALTDLESRCGVARRKIQRETDGLVAQSRARRSAAGLVADPLALETEVQIGRALEAGVLSPNVSLTSVTCVVRASEPWGIHAQG